MNESDLSAEYFEWLLQQAFPKQDDILPSYRRLCAYLDSVMFYSRLPMDENRARDGEDLRYRFGYEHHLIEPEIGVLLDCRPCSVLEMMVALALRIEEDIMADPDKGPRTQWWFLDMIESLGLTDMTDDSFDHDRVSVAVHNFLERNYAPNGKGGLFTIPVAKRDMRTLEIWYQANQYLDQILGYLR